MIFSNEKIARMQEKQRLGVSIRKIAADEGEDYAKVWRFLTGRSFKGKIDVQESDSELLARIDSNLATIQAMLLDFQNNNNKIAGETEDDAPINQ